MPELAIIADDLTGALDAAAPFATLGIKTAVALSAAHVPEAIASGARVVSVSTDSREVSPGQARAAVLTARAALPSGIKLFKKIDSRLKGNIEAELDPLPHRLSLVVPAIPAFDRWMRAGRLGGFGIEGSIDIAERLGSHAAHATIPDVESQSDIVAALATPHDLPVGARGLAEAMATVMTPGEAMATPSLPCGKAILVIGSTDPITLSQLHRLRAAAPNLTYIAAPNGVCPAVLPRLAQVTVIHATPGAQIANSRSVAIALADTLRRFGPTPDALLVLSGGATAQAILEGLGIGVLDLVGEALPGLPLALAGGLTFITKSGGFGDEDTLTRLLAPYFAHEERTA